MLMSWPVVMEPGAPAPEPTMSFAPNHDMSSMTAYIQNCIKGELKASIFSARAESRRSFSDASTNFSVS